MQLLKAEECSRIDGVQPSGSLPEALKGAPQHALLDMPDQIAKLRFPVRIGARDPLLDDQHQAGRAVVRIRAGSTLGLIVEEID